jgi:hypothetical protein
MEYGDTRMKNKSELRIRHQTKIAEKQEFE